MDFLTLAEYKLVMNINSPNKDSQLTSLISSINSFITMYIGLDESGSTSEKHILKIATDTVILKEEYTSITKITLNGEEVLDLAGYELDGSILYCPTLISGVLLFEGDKSIYTAPAALKQAAISLVTYYLDKEYITKDAGNQQVGLDTVKTIPPHIKSILDLNRII